MKGGAADGGSLEDFPERFLKLSQLLVLPADGSSNPRMAWRRWVGAGSSSGRGIQVLHSVSEGGGVQRKYRSADEV